MITGQARLSNFLGARAGARAELWEITLRDGEVLRLASWDHDLVVDGQTWQAAGALDASSGADASALTGGDRDALGVLTADVIRPQDIIGGRWDGAIVRHCSVDPRLPLARLRRTTLDFAAAEYGDQAGEAVLLRLTQRAARTQQPVGRILTRTCQYQLGDSRCGVALGPITVTGTVTAVTDARSFSASALGTTSTYRHGRLVWLTGGNQKLQGIVKSGGLSGAILLHEPMPVAIQIGDTFSVHPGCDGTFATCRTKFSNGDRHGGFPHLRGDDALLRAPPRTQ